MKTLSVGELVSQIRHLVEGVSDWQRVWVSGELSGVRHHSSGHWYFTLKDDTAQLRAVMFRRDANNLTAPLKDGMAVLAFGRVGVFERDGQTQLYVSLIRDMGRGSQDRQLQLLKERLYEEGLFSRPKRSLPLVPRAVGVITSGTGAARFDIETVVTRRFPGMPLVLYPVLVQGREATASIVDALAKIRRDDVDVIIIGRGGGAKEDLAAFNDEAVVRAVFASPVPVISAVGHEIDTTLVDLVADLRAPTPSAAAELAVPEVAQLRAWQGTLVSRLDSALRQRLTWERSRIEGWVAHGLLAHPQTLFREYRHHLDRLEERVERASERIMVEGRHRLERIDARLPWLNPELPLERGYAYVTDVAGALVTRNALQWDGSYEVHWSDGSAWVQPIPSKEREDDE